MAGDAALDVDGLEGGFALVATEAAVGGGGGEEAFGFDDAVAGPESGVLALEGDEAALGVETGGAAGFAIEHEGEEAAGFGFGGEEFDEEAGEVDRFLAEFDGGGFGMGDGVPGAAVGGIDGGEDVVEAGGHFFAGGDLEAEPGVANFRFGSDEALAHGGGGDEEGGADAFGVEAEDGLEHEGGADGGVDGGVGADEEELEAFVGEGVFGEDGLLVAEFDFLLGVLLDAVVALGVEEAVAGDGDEPGVGLGGDALFGPSAEGGEEGVGEGVFGGGDVFGAGGEDGEQAPVGVAGDLLCELLH